MSGEAALERDDAIDALYQAIDQSIDEIEANHEADDARSMVAAAVNRLWHNGFVLCRKEAQDTPPDWAEVVVNTLFTGSPLDFDGREIPPWLQARLEAEYGHPYPYRPPSGQQPPDLDESVLDGPPF